MLRHEMRQSPEPLADLAADGPTAAGAPTFRPIKAAQAASSTSETILSCRGLWKVYGAEPRIAERLVQGHGAVADKLERLRREGCFAAVSDVDIDVRKGEILMIMGLSGSGKSTVLRCFSRLIEPTAGSIRLEGVDLLGVNRSELIKVRREKIGMVFQNFGLLPHLTVLDNVAFPLRVQGMDRARRHARARQLVELVQLSGREASYPHELSGGQQQRVGIARSLATNPELWFLDEPFSALDPLIRRQMQDEFLRLQAQLNKSIVFVTHDFMEAARLGDRIAIMRAGQLVQVGSVSDILLNPRDDYVRSFVAEVPVLRTLRADQVAVAGAEGGLDVEGLPCVDGGQNLEATLPYFIDGAAAVAVRAADGSLVGTLSRDRFHDLLARTASISR